MIRWIAFDAVGTLLDPFPPVVQVYHAAAVRHGSRLPQAEISKRFRAAFARRAAPISDDTAQAAFQTDEAGERRWWRELVSEVIDDIEDSEACFEILWNHFADPSRWRIFDDVASTLAALKSRGIKLAIASNFDGRLHRFCDELPELAPIERRFISSEVGWRKPATLFYRRLLATLGCGPQELLMVGDNWDNDIRPAAALKIATAFIDRRNRPSDRVSHGPNSETATHRLTELQQLLSNPLLWAAP